MTPRAMRASAYWRPQPAPAASPRRGRRARRGASGPSSARPCAVASAPAVPLRPRSRAGSTRHRSRVRPSGSAAPGRPRARRLCGCGSRSPGSPATSGVTARPPPIAGRGRSSRSPPDGRPHARPARGRLPGRVLRPDRPHVRAALRRGAGSRGPRDAHRTRRRSSHASDPRRSPPSPPAPAAIYGSRLCVRRARSALRSPPAPCGGSSPRGSGLLAPRAMLAGQRVRHPPRARFPCNSRGGTRRSRSRPSSASKNKRSRATPIR